MTSSSDAPAPRWDTPRRRCRPNGSGCRAAPAVAGPAFRRDAGQGALLADARVRPGPRTNGGVHRRLTEPDLERLAPRSLGDRRGYRLGKAFIKASVSPERSLDGAGEGEPPIAERRQILALRPLVDRPPRTGRDPGAQVLPPPAHHPVPPEPSQGRGRPPARTRARTAPQARAAAAAAARWFASPASPAAL